MKKLEREYWRDIPGTDGKYQASTDGRIRAVHKTTNRILVPFTRSRRKHANRSALCVHLTLPNGKRMEKTVIKLISDTFFDPPDGKIAVHRNGLHSDNSIKNIMFLTSEELGKIFGSQACRRPVIKISRSGEIVDCYPSARQAAKSNHMSYQTVLDRCNNKIKRPYELDGHNYQWENRKGAD